MSGKRQWYSIRNAAPTGSRPEVLIYDEIDSWFGVDAADFVRDLAQINAPEILVRINSPGGDVFDGVSILNALRGHAARIVTQVDGLAASIASVIAMAGDEVVMAANATMMCHNSWAVCIGDAADMTKTSDMLAKMNTNIASIYAEKAGGTVDEWLEVMDAETWMTAEEAVEAGLADRVLKPDPRTSTAASLAAASFNRKRFRYVDRESAPAPTIAARLRSLEPKDGTHMPQQFSRQDDERFVDQAIHDGKILPSGRNTWLDRLKQDPTGFRNLLDAVVTIPGLNSGAAAVGGPAQRPSIDPEIARAYAKITGRPMESVQAAGYVPTPDAEAVRLLEGRWTTRAITDEQLNASIESDPEYHRAVYAISGAAGGLTKPPTQFVVHSPIEPRTEADEDRIQAHNAAVRKAQGQSRSGVSRRP